MATELDFRGTDRFVVRRRLGVGSFGVVYEAEDRERGEIVALKALRGPDSAAIYRLKKEFRTLADVAHPNLVSLYELVAADDSCFFTMELVDGVDFVAHVRAGDADFGNRVARLRHALAQLAAGVAALHVAGRLHRDIKPSNVLAARDGRVVILDFGIAAELAEPSDHVHQTVEMGVFGSPAYMAPELLFGEAATTASDWYAVGSILYEALTGKLPFTGNMRQLMAAKSGQPEPVLNLWPDCPPDLAELATSLLAPDPATRPPVESILGRVSGGAMMSVTGEMPAKTSALVGRDDAMAELRGAHAAARDAGPITVYVSGLSGIGKSTLVRAFADEAARAGAVVLSGKCYVRESLPHKALDGIVDSLSRYLRNLDVDRVAALIPQHVAPLLRTFPVLERVDALSNAPSKSTPVFDAVSLRRQAFDALQELLRRIGEQHPLILAIDDLQWADEASARRLEELLAGPGAPRALVVATFRSEDVSSHAFLRDISERVPSPRMRLLTLEPLTSAATAAIIEQNASTATPELVRQLAEESGGSPFLAEQLARHLQVAGASAPRAQGVPAMLEARIARQPVEARAFLTTLAVAAHPLDTELVRAAAAIPHATRALVTTLEAAHLLRASSEPHHVELYHDRIREAIAAQVPEDERRGIHRKLALAFELLRPDEAESLYEHWLGANDTRLAAKYAQPAARNAASSFAFDRAAHLFRSALDMLPADAPERGALFAELADVQVNRGRVAEAAEAFLAAADLAPPTQALAYRNRAAEQFLVGGHVDRGMDLLARVFAAENLRMPRNNIVAAIQFLAQRARLSLRGHEFVERRAEDVDESTLRQIDACWAGSAGLSLTQPITGAFFQGRHMLLALKAGEPHRLARAFAAETAFLAIRGRKNLARMNDMRRTSRDLAQRLNSPIALGRARMTDGISATLQGSFREAAPALEEAEQILLTVQSGGTWDLTTARTFWMTVLTYLGDVPALAGRVPAFLSDARERGNLYAETVVRVRFVLLWIARNDARAGIADVEEALGRWSTKGFYLQHLQALDALTQLAIYLGDVGDAWRRIETMWPPLKRSNLLRAQILRLVALSLRARLAVFTAAQGVRKTEMLGHAAALARSLEREGQEWARGVARLYRAGIASVNGQVEDARAHLVEAGRVLETEGMSLYAAAAKQRLGQLVGGSDGTTLMADAHRAIRDRTVAEPELLTSVYAPGLFG